MTTPWPRGSLKRANLRRKRGQPHTLIWRAGPWYDHEMVPLPADISPDFAPTPQTLWAVWAQAPDYQVETRWSDAVYQVWLLASAGPSGLEEVKRQFPSEFLAATPLEQILAARTLLSQSGQSKWAALWPTWLPKIRAASFFLRNTTDGAISWGFGNATEAASSTGGEVVLEGRMSDFINVCGEGERIMVEKDYGSILQDARPVSPGHPQDWLHFMKAPARWLPFRALMESASD